MASLDRWMLILLLFLWEDCGGPDAYYEDGDTAEAVENDSGTGEVQEDDVTEESEPDFRDEIIHVGGIEECDEIDLTLGSLSSEDDFWNRPLWSVENPQQ